MKIISESAFNHNGCLDYLKNLARESKDCNVDFFTVQVMNADFFCEKNYKKYDIYKENSFSKKEWIELFDYCKKIKLDVIPCVLDEYSFKYCYEYGFRFFKIHATDIVNFNFLREISVKNNIEIILETQCSTIQDIKESLDIIGDKVKVIFHGFSDYPTSLDDTNINAINDLKIQFPNYLYGFADHSKSIFEVPLIALGAGYDFIEKHITLDKNNKNFDWEVSIEPEEFKLMVKKIREYSVSIGNGVKHPVTNESKYRSVMFKKIVKQNSNQIRSDIGNDGMTTLFNSFDKKNVGIAIIARLKSNRLKQKVLLEFNNKTIIEDLYERMKKCKTISNVSLTTSYLDQDKYLADLFPKSNKFLGHPISVIDRLLGYIKLNKLGAVVRVTGDNPLTDYALIDKMVKLYIENGLDYVRVNNVPFGISAEIFSTEYLWKLYLKMENPHNSEYLSWDALNDKSSKKGCINFIPKDDKISYVNLSIDYIEDYNRAMELLKKIKIKDIKDIRFQDIIDNLNLNDLINRSKKIKLPNKNFIIFEDYLKLMNNIDYDVKVNLPQN